MAVQLFVGGSNLSKIGEILVRVSEKETLDLKQVVNNISEIQ